MSDAAGNGRTAFGSLLREYRLRKRLSQEALAERAKISIEAVSALERGTRKAPQAQTLALLMDALELNADERIRLDALRARRVGLAETAVHPRDAAADSPKHNLPRRLSSFVNRVDETLELSELLAQRPLVTLVGAGGVGKTRMALNLGEQLCGRFPNGVWFIEFARLTDPSFVCAEIAAALDIRETPGRPIREVLLGALRARRTLLIFDNCEHLIDEIATITQAILQSSRGTTVLATSREALRIDGEHVYRLATFAVPTPGTSADARTALGFSAVALFMERTTAHEPSFTLTDHNAGAVATLCRRLDGNPLALELAAAKIPVLSASQIVERLDGRLGFLAGERFRVQPRQQTLGALIDWSFDLLSPAEQTLFARVAIFVGSWTLDAAAEVCSGGLVDDADVLDLLASLVAKSLVLSDPNAEDGARFWFYETTREYAAQRLARAAEREDIARKHARYMLAFARHALTQRRESREKAWLDMVARDLDNVRAALNWSLGAGNDVALGAEIASALGFFWFSRRNSEGVEWLANARNKIADLPAPLAAHVYLESARVEPFSDRTLDFAERAVAAHEAIGDTDRLPESLALVGQSLLNQGRLQPAELILKRGVVLALRARDDTARAKLLGLLGFLRLYMLDFCGARDNFTAAEHLAKTIGRDREYAIALRGFAELALCEGDHDAAVAACATAVKVLEAIGDERAAAAARCHFAHCQFAGGQVAAARISALTAIRELEGMHLPMPFSHAVIVLSAICAHERDDRRAAQLLGFADARAASLPYRQPPPAQHLLDATRSSLVDRLGEAVTELFAEGARIDERHLRSMIAEGGHH